MSTTTTRRGTRAADAGQARQDDTNPAARIRIPNSMVNRILGLPPEKATLDLLQAQLLRLDESAVSQADRILVTSNGETLDLLRDWCTRLIAENRLSDEPGAKQLVASASKVIGFMDNHETKAAKAARHSGAPKTKTTHRRRKAASVEKAAS